MCLSVELRVCCVIVFNTHDNPCGVVITHSVCDKSHIGFYHSSGAPPVGADYLLGCKIVTVTGYDFVPWIAIFNTNSPNYGQVRSLQQHQRCSAVLRFMAVRS